MEKTETDKLYPRQVLGFDRITEVYVQALRDSLEPEGVIRALVPVRLYLATMLQAFDPKKDRETTRLEEQITRAHAIVDHEIGAGEGGNAYVGRDHSGD